MNCEEIAPHMYKLAKVHLKNNKRKTGWLFHACCQEIPSGTYSEIRCLNVHYARRIMDLYNMPELIALKLHSEPISIDDILHIRSMK